MVRREARSRPASHRAHVAATNEQCDLEQNQSSPVCAKALPGDPGFHARSSGAATSEDAVAAGSDQARDDEQQKREQDLALEELNDANDGDDSSDEPQKH